MTVLEMRLIFLYSSFAVVNCLQVLQVTDFHLDADYSVNGDSKKMCHLSNIAREKLQKDESNKLGKFGDYMCDSPETLVRYTVAEARRLVPNPDLILWTGDNTPHVEGYHTEYVLRGLNKTTEILFTAYPNIRILPTFGNHDYAPSNDFVENSSIYNEMYFNSAWQKQIDLTERENFLRGGFHSYRLPNSRQRILVLNTNLYYDMNKAFDNFTDPLDPAGQFRYMEAALLEAERCSKQRRGNRVSAAGDCATTIHLVAHIGPGAFERTPNITWFRPLYNERFLGIVNRFSANIGWMIFGHHHTDTFHVVRDETGAAINVAWMSPAVTPWFSTLPGAGSNNPTFRVYDIDDATGEIKDFTTYWINLDKLNAGNGTTSAVEEYSMKKTYGLSSLSPTAISSLVEKFAEDDSAFMKYITYNTAGWKPVLPKDKFRLAQLCSLRYADYPRYYACMEQSPTPSKKGSKRVDGVLSVILLASLLLL